MNVPARTIELQNVGPIDRLSIPLPEAGVVVLRGRNGRLIVQRAVLLGAMKAMRRLMERELACEEDAK